MTPNKFIYKALLYNEFWNLSTIMLKLSVLEA